jgi:hypothetical protein
VRPKGSLTEDSVREIKLLLSKGVHPKELASTYGVCVETVKNINKGKVWSCVVVPEHEASPWRPASEARKPQGPFKARSRSREARRVESHTYFTPQEEDILLIKTLLKRLEPFDPMPGHG